MKRLAGVLLLLSMSIGGYAEMVTRNVEYKQDGTVLEGYLAYDDALTGKRPGVLVVPEWWGVNDYIRTRTQEVAKMGYVAFAADMYGKGMTTTNPEEAAKLAGQFRANWDTGGRALMRARANAALATLAAQEMVDPNRLAAIGFCFGGTTVLELAYSGANLAGVVSFHGGLTAPTPEDMPGIKARFLILHGADDPHVSPEAIAAFQDAMRQMHADWQMVYFGGAVHSFTNPNAGGSPGVAYNAKAARRSWGYMQMFFKEIFATSG